MNAEDWPYRIEPMRLEDVPTVGAIERLVFSRPWPMDAYNYELLENPQSHYLVARLKGRQRPPARRGLAAKLRQAIVGAELDETLLGYGGLWLMVDEAHISTLAVRVEWQGRGIGELLLASLIEKAMELQAALVTLEVRVSNYRAQNLYKKYGFHQAGIRYRYYSDNNENAFIMTTEAIASPAYQALFRERVAALSAKLSAQAALPATEEATPQESEGKER